MKGRHVLFDVFKHFRMSETKGRIFDFRNNMHVKLHNDQFITFRNDWGYFLCTNFTTGQYVVVFVLSSCPSIVLFSRLTRVSC